MKYQQSHILKKMSLCLILLFLGLMSVTVTHAETYTSVKTWGSSGSGNGQFIDPHGVAVDSSGNVYVADLGNHRIQKFDSNGNFIIKWGSNGSDPGQFFKPFGVAVDSSDNVYVADTHNHRIQKFDGNGNFIIRWGSYGNGNEQLYYPFDIAVDSLGNVYVTDSYNHRIQKFDSNGAYLTQWGSGGSGNGQFNRPWGIDVDSSGSVYVADYLNNRIQKFDSNGIFIKTWGSIGSGDGQFNNSPAGIAVDSSSVYVADLGNNRAQKFDSSGTYLTQWGSYGSGNGQFHSPKGIAVDSSGNVYVADGSINRIQKFAVETVKKTPTIIWNNPAGITVGTALSSTQLNAVAKDPVSGVKLLGIFTYSPAAGEILAVGTHTLHVDFAPANNSIYNASSADTQINVLEQPVVPAPIINSIAVPLDPVPVDTSITTTADVTYLGDLNSLTAEWNWGDGSTTSQTQVTSNLEASHVYSTPGIYTVSLTVKEATGGSVTQIATEYIVVYDPNGGFVTGGGWINSPAGAYVADITLEGKASFGFVSKYQKDSTVPTGNTQFQFNVANLKFHSDSYDWLVVAGSQAKYKGTGTINGQGNYGFMLSAVDGAIDKFRIKIWDKESNSVIYDNEIEKGEDVVPMTAISGGSIIIHKEK